MSDFDEKWDRAVEAEKKAREVADRAFRAYQEEIKQQEKAEDSEEEAMRDMANHYGGLRVYQDAKEKFLEEFKEKEESKDKDGKSKAEAKGKKRSVASKDEDGVARAKKHSKKSVAKAAAKAGATCKSNDSDDGDDIVVVLEVPKSVHVSDRFHYLGFKEWHETNGWRFAPGERWVQKNEEEKHCSKFLGYHDRSFGDRKSAEEGAVPDDATHVSLMHATWLRRWIPPPT